MAHKSHFLVYGGKCIIWVDKVRFFCYNRRLTIYLYLTQSFSIVHFMDMKILNKKAL